MSERYLFGGDLSFQTQLSEGIRLDKPTHRFHIKVDGGPRGDVFIIKLVVGNDPNGVIANNNKALQDIQNNNKPYDLTWIVPQGIYMFVMTHPHGDPHHPITIKTNLNVYCDPPGHLYMPPHPIPGDGIEAPDLDRPSSSEPDGGGEVSGRPPS